MDEEHRNIANGSYTMKNNGEMDVYSSHKNILLQLHNEAPRPLRVDLNAEIERPPYFGSEYHGVITGREAELILQKEGQYLVRKRKSQNENTLSFKVNGTVHHYRLFYDGKYFIKSEKKFESLYKLVAEGLMVKFLERNADSYFIMHDTISVLKPTKTKLTRSKSISGRSNFHRFRVSYGLSRCIECTNLVFVSWKCNVCGYRHHDKCTKPLLEECPSRKSIFGVELTDPDFLVNEEPFILDLCIEQIETRGLDAEGIYRVSGFSEDVEKLSSEFDRDKSKTKVYTYNVHVIAGVLKRWLRKLPISVIPAYNSSNFYDALGKEDPVREIKKICQTLNTVHFNCLKRLTLHMSKVVARKDINMMSSYNLAVVFGPTLSTTEIDSIERNISVVKFLINNSENIFL